MKEKVQSFGRFLSGMVMPNIGAFIAWGFITALFIADGWIPNEAFSNLVGPMVNMLLPLLIAYTGGSVVAGQRGGVIGAIVTMGVIVGSDITMFLGAMVLGPLSGYIIKKFDKAMEGKIPAGFEMLINNFSLGFIGAVLALLALKGVAPVVTGLNKVLAAGVNVFVRTGLLPLVNLLVEPAKILFLNNALNHGIFSPMGIEQVSQIGKSIFFLLESNPGPGLGILIAYCLVGKGSAKSSAPGAVIIHFLGGIHEIYFPYILMNPVLLLAVMAGGASGTFIFSIMGAGLRAPASPGSILAILAMTPKDAYLGVILGVVVSTIVSCAAAIPILKLFGKDDDLDTAKNKVSAMKSDAKGIANGKTNKSESYGKISKIVFACDAGMGSSAMGATVLRKKLAAAGLGHIEVIHASVSEIPKDAQIVVTHTELKERAEKSNPVAKLVLITNFMAAPEYDQLVQDLKNH